MNPNFLNKNQYDSTSCGGYKFNPHSNSSFRLSLPKVLRRFRMPCGRSAPSTKLFIDFCYADNLFLRPSTS